MLCKNMFVFLPAVFFTIHCQVILHQGLIVAHNAESNPKNIEDVKPLISLYIFMIQSFDFFSWSIEEPQFAFRAVE